MPLANYRKPLVWAAAFSVIGVSVLVNAFAGSRTLAPVGCGSYRLVGRLVRVGKGARLYVDPGSRNEAWIDIEVKAELNRYIERMVEITADLRTGRGGRHYLPAHYDRIESVHEEVMKPGTSVVPLRPEPCSPGSPTAG